MTNAPRCTRCGEPLFREDTLHGGLPGRTEVWACAASHDHPKLFIQYGPRPCPKCGRADGAFHCEDSGQDLEIDQQFAGGECATCGHGPRAHCLDHHDGGIEVLCTVEGCNPHSLDWRVCSRIPARDRVGVGLKERW